jgi:gastricsin
MNLKNYYNYNYVGTIQVGTPPQEVRVIWDTGSTNSWILSSYCDSVRCHDGTNEVFNPEYSTTFVGT